ncbi:metallophosphoesterase [Actinokineospora spheciospongiae]|uniref:metallophosphoesterase n=1 Tax=Actinokineospora spheciospongiae TaxID=909613 RepID=UPI000D7111A1|nr:metallophosphoesterase [Actinokineospora spheciospongiae]PWW62791.1 calcineurin-like phosphoesterase family protein [Actinokineospora spheciospongiae]
MWLVDDGFLRGVASGESPWVRTVEVPRDRPYFDIEAVADVRQDRPGEGGFLERFRRLRRPFNEGRPCHLLVSCGDLVPARSARPGQDEDWGEEFARLRPSVSEVLAVPGNHDIARDPGGAHFHRRLLPRLLANAEVLDEPRDLPVASVTRVRFAGEEAAEPLAHVVVIGFDSTTAEHANHFIEDHGQIGREQTAASLELVRTLARTIAGNTPLYVIGVAHHHLLASQDRAFPARVARGGLESRAATLECRENPAAGGVSALCRTNHMIATTTAGDLVDGPTFLAHCRDLRMSLVLHAHMHRREVATLSTAALAPGERPTGITVVACPPFAPDLRSSGMARVRVNVWKGEAEVAFSHDDEFDGPSRPIQVVRPLVSASRVTPAERRLHETVTGLLADSARTAGASPVAGLSEFTAHVARTWEETGYVALCNPDGSFPALPAARRTTYFLLLLLRERVTGGHDILLNNHTPLRPSQIGDWESLLLPAFKNVRALLEHLRDDVLRQVVDQAEDLEKAAHVRAFEEAAGRILDERGSTGEDTWADQLREVATFTKRKISPTTGHVTEYEYQLVTLLPLVRRPDREPRAGSTEADPDARREQRHRDFDAIMDWLNELPSVRRHGDRARGARIPIEALRPGGSGMRWEPAGTSGDRPRVRAADTVHRVPPGGVWFPVPDGDDERDDSLWRQCPSIVARNADVMTWVEDDLIRRRTLAGGSFPPELVVGKLGTGGNRIRVVGPRFPFEVPPGGRGPAADVPSTCTVDAIAKVRYVDGYDLEGQHPYAGLETKRVFLVRQEVPAWRGTRQVLLVFDADAFDRGVVPRLRADAALGVLRPVQRYVLRAGLERANELYEQVLGGLDDEWGFVRVRKGDAPKPVTVTPPVIENLHPDDWEDERGNGEFIVCDGNHRVVELAWNQRIVLPAIAVVGEPGQPYYARPFSRYEWSHTAENVRDRSPDQASKYAVRKVDLETLTPSARERLSHYPASEHYRRYYRDLTAGFGYLGGQGGRYV